MTIVRKPRQWSTLQPEQKTAYSVAAGANIISGQPVFLDAVSNMIRGVVLDPAADRFVGFALENVDARGTTVDGLYDVDTRAAGVFILPIDDVAGLSGSPLWTKVSAYVDPSDPDMEAVFGTVGGVVFGRYTAYVRGMAHVYFDARFEAGGQGVQDPVPPQALQALLYGWTPTPWTDPSTGQQHPAGGGWVDVRDRFRVVATIADRDALPADQVREGALVYVVGDDNGYVWREATQSWEPRLFNEATIRTWITQLSLFRGTAVEVGNTAPGTVDLASLPDLTTVPDPLNHVAHYWTWQGTDPYQVTAATANIGADLAGAQLHVGDWLQISNQGTTAVPDLHWTHVTGDLLQKSRGDKLYSLTPWVADTWELNAVVEHQGKLYRATSAHLPADGPPGATPLSLTRGAVVSQWDSTLAVGVPAGVVAGDVIEITGSFQSGAVGEPFENELLQTGDLLVFTGTAYSGTDPVTAWQIDQGWARIPAGDPLMPATQGDPVEVNLSAVGWAEVPLDFGGGVTVVDTLPAGLQGLEEGDAFYVRADQGLYVLDLTAQAFIQVNGGAVSSGSTGGSIAVGTTAPPAPAAGDAWFDTTPDYERFYIHDGTQWIPQPRQTIHSLGDPSSAQGAAKGDLHFRTGSRDLAIYDGSAWQEATEHPTVYAGGANTLGQQAATFAAADIIQLWGATGPWVPSMSSSRYGYVFEETSNSRLDVLQDCYIEVMVQGIWGASGGGAVGLFRIPAAGDINNRADWIEMSRFKTSATYEGPVILGANADAGDRIVLGCAGAGQVTLSNDFRCRAWAVRR